jgi:hypothetical protein
MRGSFAINSFSEKRQLALFDQQCSVGISLTSSDPISEEEWQGSGPEPHLSNRWRGASQLKLHTVTTDASVCACRVLMPPASVSGLGAISAYSLGLLARAHLRPASCRTQR